jgi:hypothetical protein
MTIQEKAKALIPLLQAIVDERVVEVNNVVEYGKYNWEDMERVVNDTLSTTLRSINTEAYRIKPEPKEFWAAVNCNGFIYYLNPLRLEVERYVKKNQGCNLIHFKEVE